MSEPFIGEIRMVGFNFAPVGWAFCDGQMLSISQNEPLFSLIGTTYGGDGVNTFALPDLRGRAPLHGGPGYQPAEAGGVETVTLTEQQMPAHTHAAQAYSLGGNRSGPAGALWARDETFTLYSTLEPNVNMNPGAIRGAGKSKPHDNMMPYLTVNFIIALDGIYPGRE